MEDEFNDKSEIDFTDEIELKKIEDFFSKKINNSLTPQELITLSYSLEYTRNVLVILLKNTHMALFDVEDFIKKYPGHEDLDFNNLDADALDLIRSLIMPTDSSNNEYFNSGHILIENIIKVIDSISSKIRISYMVGYRNQAPNDTIKFFTILENSLESSLKLLQNALTPDE